MMIESLGGDAAVVVMSLSMKLQKFSRCENLKLCDRLEHKSWHASFLTRDLAFAQRANSNSWKRMAPNSVDISKGVDKILQNGSCDMRYL